MSLKTIKVWDKPTRFFHWSLVLGIFTCWLSIENRWLLVHQISGLTILGLLIYRVIWGFVGARTARFSDFITWPWLALKYLKNSLQKHNDYHTGHNPAGGWMVIALLSIIALQVITGLLGNDDIGFSGPLADLVTKEVSDSATQIHVFIFDLLLAFIWLHLVAVFFYVLVKNQNLIKAMLTGKKPFAQAGKTTHLFFVSKLRVILVLAIAITIPTTLYLLQN